MTDQSFESVAERKFIGVRGDGERVSVHLCIGRPYESREAEWACPVVVSGLEGRLGEMHGVDSLQALLEAIFIARSFIAMFIERGGRLFWPDDEASGPVTLEEIFGALRR